MEAIINKISPVVLVRGGGAPGSQVHPQCATFVYTHAVGQIVSPEVSDVTSGEVRWGRRGRGGRGHFIPRVVDLTVKRVHDAAGTLLTIVLFVLSFSTRTVFDF